MDQVFARIGQSGTTDWYLTDQLGSVRGLMNNSGTLDDSKSFDAWGNLTSESTPANGDRFGFAGGQTDSNRGTVRFGAREVTTADGSWSTTDPLGLFAGTNLYRYSSNSPTNLTDLSGLNPEFNHGNLSRALFNNDQDFLNRYRDWSNAQPRQHSVFNDGFARFSNFCAGMGDTVSFGLTGRFRRLVGYDDVVNYNSGAYRAGQIAGVVVSVPLMFGNPCGAGASFLSRGLQGSRFLGAFRAINGVQAAGGVFNAAQHIANDQWGWAALDVLGIFGNMGQIFRSCFVAGTPLLTPDGEKLIEEFKEGDYLLSAPENDSTAPIEPRQVEEVFIRVSPIVNLHVGNRVIRTTPEHPFFVDGRGWVPTSMLEIGDLLRSHDGQWLAVQAVTDSGEVTTVYNLRIAEYHTYFVGTRAWGFSVWAHNALYPIQTASPRNPVPLPPPLGSSTYINAAGQVIARTQGTLSWIRGGATSFISGITSGIGNALSNVPGIARIFNPANMRNWFHVEAQAIALMRILRIREATLVVNNVVCPACLAASMQYRLPVGFVLTIKDTAGNILKVITGRGVIR